MGLVSGSSKSAWISGGGGTVRRPPKSPPVVTSTPSTFGWSTAIVSPISPPIDHPSSAGFFMPSARMSAAVSSAIWRMVIGWTAPADV